MSHIIRKSHNVSILVYHFVCPAKYRRAVIDEKVDQVLKDVCLEIAQRYQIEFLGARSIRASAIGQEAIVGWRILDRWLLCWHHRATCHGRGNSTVCQKP